MLQCYYQLFQIKKESSKEEDVEARCIVAYAIEENAEDIDSLLRQLVIDRMDILSYYLFINRSSKQKKQTLVLNRLQNVKMKCRIIKKSHFKE